jgi:hypothetical protein
MKFVISNLQGNVYWMEVGEILYAPLRRDDTFDLKEASLVQSWDDVRPGEKARILELLSQ